MKKKRLQTEQKITVWMILTMTIIIGMITAVRQKKDSNEENKGKHNQDIKERNDNDSMNDEGNNDTCSREDNDNSALS